jgi:hypothetical protein
MNPNSIVIVSLHSPKEKVWGILRDINPSGVTIRGIDLNSFDHFVSEINQLHAERIGLPGFFPHDPRRAHLSRRAFRLHPQHGGNFSTQNRPQPF